MPESKKQIEVSWLGCLVFFAVIAIGMVILAFGFSVARDIVVNG